MKYQNAVLITGPTTTGKTDISVELARKLDGEIINSDRLFVYSFMKIGSGLSDCIESSDIPRHLYGICEPNEILTTEEYVRRVEEIVPRILTRNRLPIIEGCSSIYNPALLASNNLEGRIFDYSPAIAITWPKETNLRAEVEKRLNKMFTAGLLDEAEIIFKKNLKDTHPIKISAVYNPLMKYFENKCSLESAKEEIVDRWVSFAIIQQKKFENIDGIITIVHDRKKTAETVDKITKLICDAQNRRQKS